jgi:hypothetical protein
LCASLLPLMVLAATAPVPRADSNALRLELVPAPARDEANEDSVVYAAGFEDGWEEWTSDDLTDVSNMWHTSDTYGYEGGSSWWCGDEGLGGYDDHWLQYLITPALNLSAYQDIRLNFKLFWSVENPAVGGAPTDPYDAWDGCNVWISTDGGESWEVIPPTTPEYTHESLYSFGFEWGMGADIPGWCASSGDWPQGAWLDASFDLSGFRGEDNVRVRWAFASDPAWHTGGAGDPDKQAIGMQVDEMEVMADNNLIWSNDGGEVGDLVLANEQGEPSGDYWEITDAAGHESDFSAHATIHEDLLDALVSPPLIIPSAEWYTYLDFWVRCDLRLSDANGDGGLDDYFRLDYSTDGITWKMVIYDYAADNWHSNWWRNFGYYGPDTAFQRPWLNPQWEDFQSWQWKLNFSQFAGDTVWLRWVLMTDDDMSDPQGTGLYIDDVHLNVSARLANDVGVEWLSIAYPTMVGFANKGAIQVRNFGMSDQDVIYKYFQIDDNAPVGIPPPDPLAADSSDIYTFRLVNIPYADTVAIRGYTALDGDQQLGNDSYTVRNVVIYPPGVTVLGYDQHDFRYTWSLDRGTGPAVLFTPLTDGFHGNYDIKALRVRWNGASRTDADIRLHIFEDDNSEPGNEIYSEEITVTNANLITDGANVVHVIDLTGVEEVQGLSGKFWVWFELLDDAPYPQILGDIPDIVTNSGHFFQYNGTDVPVEQEVTQYQIHAVIMPEGTEGRELTPGRRELDFDAVRPGFDRTMRVAMFNGSTQPVTIDNVTSTNPHFELEPLFETPLTLQIGDLAPVYVYFVPEAEEEYSGEIQFETDDETPPVVRLLGVGDNEAGVSDGDRELPNAFSLSNARPNPFNALTTIPYSLPRASDVKLAVYDLTGRLVATLLAGQQPAGYHTARFNAGGLGSGIYIYRLEAGGFTAQGKMALIK